MGGQYSLGVVPDELEPLSRFSKLEACHRKYLKVVFARNPSDQGHFMSYSDFRAVFHMLSPAVAHSCFTKYFQRNDDGDETPARIATVAEVWGALVLVSLIDVNSKVRFLFALHDKDRDKRMNKVELRIALESSAVALARLKRNPFPPPAKLLSRLVDDIFSDPTSNLNDRGEIDCQSVMSYMVSDKKCMKYFQNLEVGSFDTGAMLRRQEKVMLELAALDSRLIQVDSDAHAAAVARERYLDERGGGVATGLLRAMHIDDEKFEVETDLLLKYSLRQAQPTGYLVLPASNDMTAFGGGVEPTSEEKAASIAESRAGSALKGKRPPSPPAGGQLQEKGDTGDASVEGGGSSHLSSLALTQSSSVVSPSDDRAGSTGAEYEAMVQAERRNARAAAKLDALSKGHSAPEAKAFGKGKVHSLQQLYAQHLAKANRLRQERDQAKASGKDLGLLAAGTEEKGAMEGMRGVWLSVADPSTGLAQLDLDTFLDIWEAGTGELMSDREATRLLFEDMAPHANQMGQHTFDSLRVAFKARQASKKDRERPPALPWQQVVQAVHAKVVEGPRSALGSWLHLALAAGRQRRHDGLYMEDVANAREAAATAARLAWEAGEEAKLALVKAQRKAQKKAEKHRAHVLSQARALEDTALVARLEAEEVARKRDEADAEHADADAAAAALHAASGLGSQQGNTLLGLGLGVNGWPPSGGRSIGVAPHTEWTHNDAGRGVYFVEDYMVEESTESWVPRSLRAEATAAGISWPPPVDPNDRVPDFGGVKSLFDDDDDDASIKSTAGSTKKSGAKGKKGGSTGGASRFGDDDDDGGEGQSESVGSQVPVAAEPSYGTTSRVAGTNWTFSVGHLEAVKSSLTFEVLGSAGSAPGSFQVTPEEAAEEARFAKMNPTDAAIARSNAAAKRAMQRLESILPPDEPLPTTAARLLRLLEEEQLNHAENIKAAKDAADAVAAASSTAFSAAPPSTTADDKEDWLTRFQPASCAWVDLETIYGGDPEVLPLLERTAKAIQACLDAIVPDDCAPTCELARVRVVRCRLSKTDLRRQRRKDAMDQRKADLKAAHKLAAKNAEARGEHYEKPSKNKKKKKKKKKAAAEGSAAGEGGGGKGAVDEDEEDFSFHFFIRVVIYSSRDPITDCEEAFKRGIATEDAQWRGPLTEPIRPSKTEAAAKVIAAALSATSGGSALSAESTVGPGSIASLASGGSEAARRLAVAAAAAAAALEDEATAAETADGAPGAFATPRDDDEAEVKVPTVAGALELLRFSVDMDRDFDALLAVGGTYADLRNGLYGVQVNELPPEIRDSPIKFGEWTRVRRNAALAVADELEKSLLGGRSRLSNEEVHAMLKERGCSVLGSTGELKARLAAHLRAHADRIGFGELSQLGSNVARSIFRRFACSAERAIAMGPKAVELPIKVHDVNTPFGYAAELAAEAAAVAAAAAEAESKEEASLASKGKGKPKGKPAASSGSSVSSGVSSVGGSTQSSVTSMANPNQKEDIGLTYAEHVAMQRALRRPLAACRDPNDYKQAMAASEVLCDTAVRPTEEGFVAYYAGSAHGELYADAKALGLGSLDDLVTAFVTISAKGDGGKLVALGKHLLSPHPSIDVAAKAFLARMADVQELYVDAEVSKLSEVLMAAGSGWRDHAQAPLVPDMDKAPADAPIAAVAGADDSSNHSPAIDLTPKHADGGAASQAPEEGGEQAAYGSDRRGVAAESPLVTWVRSIGEGLRAVVTEPAFCSKVVDACVEALRSGDAALLPQLRAAARGHFGAHWRDSFPGEWDDADGRLIMGVRARERAAALRARDAERKAALKSGAADPMSLAKLKREAEKMEKAARESGAASVATPATAVTAKPESVSTKPGSGLTSDNDASGDTFDPFADEESFEGTVDPTAGVWGLEWLHGGHLEPRPGTAAAEAIAAHAADALAGAFDGASAVATNATGVTNATSDLTFARSPTGSRAASRAGTAHSPAGRDDNSSAGGASHGGGGAAAAAEEVKEEEEEDYCELEVGSTGKLFELQATAARLRTLLNGKITKNEKDDYIAALALARKEAAVLERTLHHRRWLALAHGLRAYSAVSRVCKGVACFGAGNRTLTARVCLDGVDFIPHCFPAEDEALPDPKERFKEETKQVPEASLRASSVGDDSLATTLVTDAAGDHAGSEAAVEAGIMRPVPLSEKEAHWLKMDEAQHVQRVAIEYILDVRKKRWAASASGMAAMADILRREAEAAKMREGMCYADGFKALRKARQMAEKGYVRLPKDPPLDTVTAEALEHWRDLREAVAARNRFASDEWNRYEAAMKAPKSRKQAGALPPVMPLLPRPLAVNDKPADDWLFFEVAVCEANLAVMLSEFADGRVEWSNEARTLVDRAATCVDKVVDRYEKDARRKAGILLSSGRAVLPFLPEPEPVPPSLRSPDSDDERKGRIVSRDGSQDASRSRSVSPLKALLQAAQVEEAAAVKAPAPVEASVEESAEAPAETEVTVACNVDAGVTVETEPPGSFAVAHKAKAIGEEDSDEEEEEEEDPEAKKYREAREALFLDQQVAKCLPDTVRVAVILVRHNRFRIMVPEVDEDARAAAAAAAAAVVAVPLSGASVASAVTEGSSRPRSGSPGKAPRSGSPGKRPGSRGESPTKPPTAAEKKAAEAKAKADKMEAKQKARDAKYEAEKAARAAAESTAYNLVNLAIYERSQPAIIAKAGSEAPKLSQYLGVERLGKYPPYEFEVIFEERRQAIINAKRDAKRKRHEAREVIRQGKRDRALAKEARKALKEDPFNIDLIEQAGFTEKAKMLRAREMKRTVMLQLWEEKQKADAAAKINRLRKAAADDAKEEAKAKAKAEARHQPKPLRGRLL